MEVRLISKIQSKMTGKRIVAKLPDDPGFTHIADIELWDGDKMIEQRAIYTATHQRHRKIQIT